MEQRRSLGSRILHSAIARILIGVIVCVTIIVLGQSFIPRGVGYFTSSNNVQTIIACICVSAFVLYGYIKLYGVYEKRQITELSTKNMARHLGAGILIGVAYQALVILVIYLSGGYSISSVNAMPRILPYLVICVNAGITEEILLRGIIFRITEEKLGSYCALLISAAIFGALHIANENSTPLAAVAIAVEAGLLLGAAYMYTRSLWLPIAIHFAWNFAQSGIFGASTSGFAVKHSFITAQISGSKLITGGLFGPEASVQAMLIGLLAAGGLLYLCHKRHGIIPPYWKNKPAG